MLAFERGDVRKALLFANDAVAKEGKEGIGGLT